MPSRYTTLAIILHWLIALAIILQLISGLWMVRAINVQGFKQIAYNFYQYHKAVGLIVLILSLIRLVWRIGHRPPPLPDHMTKWEKLIADMTHKSFYFFMIFIPLLGWAMVSTSPYGLPTIIFGLFEWPHISFLTNLDNSLELNKIFENGHEYLSYLMAILLIGHVAAALKHQFIDKDDLIKRMIPTK